MQQILFFEANLLFFLYFSNRNMKQIRVFERWISIWKSHICDSYFNFLKMSKCHRYVAAAQQFDIYVILNREWWMK